MCLYLDYRRNMLRIILDLFATLWKAYWLIAYAFAVSLAIFASFYLFYLPTAMHVKPVHFQYSSDCKKKVDDSLCSFPSAELILHDSSKAADDGIRVLTRGQMYDISLDLELPFSEQNKQLGMFMVQIDLLDKDKKKVGASSRSTMLRYESSLLTTVNTIFNIIPLVCGFKEQKQSMHLPLFEQFMDDSYYPAMSAEITIHSKYIQLYSAQIKFVAVFTGIRYYMVYWPITFNLLAFSSIFCCVLLFCLWRSVRTTMSFEEDEYGNLSDSSGNEEEEEEEGVEDIFGGSEKQRGKLRSRRSRSNKRENDSEAELLSISPLSDRAS